MAPGHLRSAALLCVLLAPALLAGCAAPSAPANEPPPTPPASQPPPAAPQPPTTPPPPPEPQHAPIPAAAKGPAIDPQKGYRIEDLGDGLHVLTDGTYQMMFLATGQGVIVVDAPPNLGAKMLPAIAEVTTEPVTHVVYSHSHADHIAAAGIFPANATYVAHAATVEQLRAHNLTRSEPFGTYVGGGPVPMPTLTFEGNHTLTVGNQTLELHHLGPAHEEGNLFIWAPQQKVLMLVDVIFPGWSPFLRLALAEDIPAFVRAHDQALAFPFETFVGGHLTRLGTREDVQTQRAYVQDLRANAARALQTTDFMAIAQRTGFENLWLLFGTYVDEVAATCEELTLATWRDRLGGADVFTRSHCDVMAGSLRID